MRIYLEDQVLEFNNNVQEIVEMLNEIDTVTNKSSKILSHMLIDGYAVYGDYYNYLLDNIKVVEEVIVKLLTYEELINDILISTLDYINNSIKAIEELSNQFYRNPEIESWNNLNDFLEGISWIFNSFMNIDNNPRLNDLVSSYEGWNLYAKEVFELKEILIDFEEALSNTDNIGVADVIFYEIIPTFNRIEDILSRLVNIEEDSYYLNWQ